MTRSKKLRAAILKKFAPHFAPHAKLIFMRSRSPVVDSNTLERLGLSIGDRRKWPDVMLYESRRKRLFLFEVHGSRGPISQKRREELETFFSRSQCQRVYVSVFADFDDYIRHAQKIGWDTDVWLVDTPNHAIHHNGVEHLRGRWSTNHK